MDAQHDALELFRRTVERLELDGWQRRSYSEHPPEARFERLVYERVRDATLGTTGVRAQAQFYDVWIDDGGVVRHEISRGLLHEAH